MLNWVTMRGEDSGSPGQQSGVASWVDQRAKIADHGTRGRAREHVHDGLRRCASPGRALRHVAGGFRGSQGPPRPSCETQNYNF